jgi:pimeloyl-ACP methyl ester carboxylesterase
MQKKTIVFINGAWVNSSCWDQMKLYFEDLGYECLTPDWPFKDKSVPELNSYPNPQLAHLGIADIVNHYAEFIRKIEQPIIIGHSFGGLFTQMLLERGLGVAGVALNSAPPKGVFAFYPSSFRSNFKVIARPFGWKKIHNISPGSFAYAFTNKLTAEGQRDAYSTYVVPETGRIFFQAALSMFNDTTKIDFAKVKQPLLLISGSEDHICPAAQVRGNFGKYKGMANVTYKEFAGKTHWIIAEPGWQDVADTINSWLKQNLA